MRRQYDVSGNGLTGRAQVLSDVDGPSLLILALVAFLWLLAEPLDECIWEQVINGNGHVIDIVTILMRFQRRIRILCIVSTLCIFVVFRLMFRVLG